MQVTVYADMVFLINYIMDLFIFWIVSKLIKKKVKIFRLMLGALCMAILYCLIIFVPALMMFYNFFTALFILSLGIVMTFSPKSLKEYLKLLLFAHISAFSIGGLGIAIFYYSNISAIIGNFISLGVSNISIKILVASICTAYIVIKFFSIQLRNMIINKQSFYTIRIHCRGVEISINTLLDSGNSLKCPLSDMPVIIAEFQAIKKFLPDSLKLIFYESKEENLSDILGNLENNVMSSRIRMIPYVSVGRQNGMLIGFKPDEVEIFQENRTISVRDCVIGIYNHRLSGDGSYQGLLNPELIQQN